MNGVPGKRLEDLRSPVRSHSCKSDIASVAESFSAKLSLDESRSDRASKIYMELAQPTEQNVFGQLTPQKGGTARPIASPLKSPPVRLDKPLELVTKQTISSPRTKPSEFVADKMIASSPRRTKSSTINTISPSGSSIFSPGFTHGDSDSLWNLEESIDDELYEAVMFIVSLPEKSSFLCSTLLRNPSAPKLTLVLDLDETLVHCVIGKFANRDHSFVLDVPGRLNSPLYVSVSWRPYLFKFLESIRGRYEIILFTASQKIYANTLLDVMDPDRNIFDHRLFRDSCRLINGSFIKDLDVIGRDLSTTLIVDNAPQAYAYNVSNGYPIPSWYDNPEDNALLELSEFLGEHFTEDVDIRTVIQEKFPLHKTVLRYKQMDLVDHPYRLAEMF